MHYLVTGGAGFIGSNITAELLRRGETITVLDDFSTGRKENIAAFRDRIELIEGSITDFDTVTKAVSGVDYVIHHAAVPSVVVSIEDPVGSSEVNIGGTLRLLEASKRAGVKRFVFASSAAVYGDLPSLPKTEESELQTLSPYAAAKLTGEYFCKIYYRLFGLQTVSLRYFNVFGPNQDPKSEYAAVIPRFINALLAGTKPVIFGDGMQSRDFIYVDDVVAANLLAIESNDAVGETINVAGGRRFSLLDLLGILKEVIGVEIKPIFEKEKQGDIKHSVADVSKAAKLLRYKLRVDFREGLSRTVEYFKTVASKKAWTE